ncbi:MAG: hypothetical protein ACRD2W_12625 [Acidimicrobiales bacterium]
MKRKIGLAVLGLALVGLAAPAGAQTGNQSFLIHGEGDDPATVVATGPTSGVGLDFESEATETAVFEFDGGGFAVDHPSDSDDFDFDPRTCIGTDRFTGTYSLSGGSGAYAGVSGTGTYRGRAIFVAKRLPDGSCSEEEAPVLNFFIVRAHGTTTLP